MFHLVRLADRLFGLDRRPRFRNSSRRVRSNHRPQVMAEVSLLESRCLLSTGVPGMHQASKTSLHASTADPVYWHTNNVTMPKHPSGATAVEVTWYSSGTNPWDAIYGESGFSLERGATYEIKYGASQILKDNPNDTYRINLQEANGPNYTSFFLDDAIGNGRSHTARVTMTQSVPEASLQFQFGGGGHREFVFTDFSIHKV